MKNKERYDLNTIDYEEEGDLIQIYRISRYRSETVASFEKYFDEPPFRAFMRWLETDEEKTE